MLLRPENIAPTSTSTTGGARYSTSSGGALPSIARRICSAEAIYAISARQLACLSWLYVQCAALELP